MAGEMFVKVVGNVTRDPELRVTPNGRDVVSVDVAQNARFLDRATGEWRDGETTYVQCDVWGEMAQNVAQTLKRGMRITAYGRLTVRPWLTRDDEPRATIHVNVDDIGPDLRFATATVYKVNRSAADPRHDQDAPDTDEPALAADAGARAPF